MNRWVRGAARGLAACFFLTFPLEAFARSRGWKMTGSGFIGSLAGVACARFLPTSPMACLCVILGVILFSAVVSEIAEEDFARKDDQRIVIDEWAGYLVSVAWLPPTAFTLWGGFLLFRLFDTTKPLGIHRLGHLPGGWGVVLDDVAAGVFANLLLRAALLCPLVKPIG